MLAKAILPWFGGVASVWIVAILFFQGMLVFGYGYAYLLTRFLPGRVQAIGHTALLIGSLALMPIAPWSVWHPGAAGDPPLQILRILFLSVGLSYFLLSTTSPLIQAWYARSQHVVFPYRLFALSNLGSLAALLAYPVVIEPFITTRHQLIVWSWFYGAFVLSCIAAAAHFARPVVESPGSMKPAAKQPLGAPGLKDHLLWLALAGGGSALLLTVTNHLCHNVAPIPLLWVLPLATYLLTFILCFDRQGWYRPAYLRLLLPVALGVMMYRVFYPPAVPDAKTEILIYLACLFAGCMFCHGELAHRKPHGGHLTSYYLMIALGGAAASVVIVLVLPHVSSWQVEFPETLVSVGILALFALYPRHWVQRTAMVALAGILVLLAAGVIREPRKGVILQARSFYGALSVTEGSEMFEDPRYTMRTLYHGAIQHGTQFQNPGLAMTPTSYYGPKSGVGFLLTNRRNRWDVGVIGLGSGTLAAYGRPLDTFKFYEIDPLIFRVAQDQFSYLKSSPAIVKTIIGDGRLSLEKESANQFNLLAIDAFSGDFVPTHLLTREAFEMYFSKLKADGVIAVHVSNQYINLQPVLASVTAALNKRAVLVQGNMNDTSAALYSEWVLIANDPAAFERVPQPSRQELSQVSPAFEVWTDDYSNVLQLLK
jgi:hypothetical protein